ncbi:hypothetical protein [Actinomadura rugatobispora]|uniref:Helix-turn-helix domain-containing protein n=1 Tax=Actinomadura rugatobispora TaxID=1994 RepID=A0ABW0ZNC9_9ACTN|nr:hypothetical protein GCM10010200_036000 [Actinomadura rugatobispora]
MTARICSNCDNPRQPSTGGHGWCSTCYHRWYRAGAHEGEPPPPPRHGPEHSAMLREEVVWLVEGGTSVADAAARVGITVDTARAYIPPTAPPAECAHDGCTATAVHRKWCTDHKDVRRLYQELRAGGVGRHDAARRIGVGISRTYVWEPGQRGQGRPPAPCGTDAAYHRHRRNGEPIDKACRTAHSARVATYIKTSTPVPCTACGEPRPLGTGGHGYCIACYGRWHAAGKPETGPPPPSKGPAASVELREEYFWLRDGGESIPEAARRVGIKPSTADTWERKRKAGAL